MTAYISGIGAFMPHEPVTNSEMEKVLGQVGGVRSRSRAVVLRNNGIKTRHYAIDPATGRMTHTNRDLTVEAIEELCRRTGFSLTDLDCLACGTTSPDQLLPNHAVMVHAALNSPPCEVVSTAGACASGVTAFQYAYLNVLSGNRRNAIVTGSELSSAYMRAAHFSTGHQAVDTGDEQAAARIAADPVVAMEADFLRWMLSDGAGAVLITNEPRGDSVSLRIDWTEIISLAPLADPCMYWGAEKQQDGTLVGWGHNPGQALRDGHLNLQQDARQLGQLITKLAGESLTILHKRRKVSADQYDWWLPHLSSEYFREPVTRLLREHDLDFPQDKWFTNLSYKGNTGSASIFIMLEELLNGGRLMPGQKLLCHVPESSRFTYAYFQLTVV